MMKFSPKLKPEISNFFDLCQGRTLQFYSTSGAKIETRQSVNNAFEEKTFYKISFDYDADTVKSIKKIPGAAYQSSGKFWTAPKSSELEVQEFTEQYCFTHVTEITFDKEEEKDIK